MKLKVFLARHLFSHRICSDRFELLAVSGLFAASTEENEPKADAEGTKDLHISLNFTRTMGSFIPFRLFSSLEARACDHKPSENALLIFGRKRDRHIVWKRSTNIAPSGPEISHANCVICYVNSPKKVGSGSDEV
jgi:hypothetical protein